MGARCHVPQQATQRSEIVDELLCAWPDLVPDGIEDATYNHVKGPEVRVVDGQIVEVKLMGGRE